MGGRAGGGNGGRSGGSGGRPSGSHSSGGRSHMSSGGGFSGRSSSSGRNNSSRPSSSMSRPSSSRPSSSISRPSSPPRRPSSPPPSHHYSSPPPPHRHTAPPPPPPPPRNYGGYNSYSRPSYTTHHRSIGASIGSFVSTIVMLVVLICLCLCINNCSGNGNIASALKGSSLSSGSLGSGKITASTYNREKISGTEKISKWYEDDIGDWVYNPSTLEKGLKYFYDKTGVQPYVIITDNIAGNEIPTNAESEKYLGAIYSDLMPDDGHLIFAFIENDNGYMMQYYAGSTASTVFDTEAADILMDYFDSYYYSDLDTEEYFATCFTKAADRMMEKTVTAGEVVGKAIKTIVIVFLVIIGIITGLVVFLVIWEKKKKQKNIESENVRKLLETPLEDLARDANLENKYQ